MCVHAWRLFLRHDLRRCGVFFWILSSCVQISRSVHGDWSYVERNVPACSDMGCIDSECDIERMDGRREASLQDVAASAKVRRVVENKVLAGMEPGQ